MANTLYFGDNLSILTGHDGQGAPYFPNGCVDLVYLDPPFNSNRSYNVLFKDEHGAQAPASIRAFEDTWNWAGAVDTYNATLADPATPDQVRKALEALHDLLGASEMMAYLAMMTPRLVQLHRVLKSTGSLYLHCDPTASHYLKIVLDAIFGPENFRNEIVWRRYGTHNDVGQGSRHFGRVHDVILFYAKAQGATWNQVFVPLAANYVMQSYRLVEEGTGRRFMTTPLTGPGGAAKGNPVFEWKGHTRAWRYNQETMERLDREGRLYYSKTGYARQKKYLDESKGAPVQDEWDDVPSLQGSNLERLGYPTQKPVALLKRIIEASSNPGDVVLDPFCGCGTAIDAAHELGRHWIGIDVTHLAINLIKVRLTARYGLKAGVDYSVVGEPGDIGAAHALAENDRDGFEYWALSLVDARPWEGKQQKGADRGRDGLIIFFDDETRKPRRAVVSVKSGRNIGSRDIRDLRGTVEREKAELGVFVTLTAPTKPMIDEAAEAGVYAPAHYKPVHKIQILTIADLLAGMTVDIPGGRHNISTFQRAQRAETRTVQPALFPTISDDSGNE